MVSLGRILFWCALADRLSKSEGMTTKPGFLIFEFVSFLPDSSTDDKKGAKSV